MRFGRSDTTESSRRRRGTAAGALGVVGLVATAVATAWWTWRGMGEPVVLAEGGPQDDEDGDGLCDELEAVLGTRADRFDMDGDGFGDAEEVARGSHPVRAKSVPGVAKPGLAMEAYLGEGGKVHAVTAIFLPDADPRGKVLEFGAIIAGALVPVPVTQLRGGRPTRSVNASTGGRVYVLDPVIPARRVRQSGGFSLACRIAENGGYLAADAVNLNVVDNEIFEHVVLNPSGTQGDVPLNVGTGIGGVYRPIGPGDGTANYVVGQICAQTTVVIGVVGALVTQEVVSADCVPGWDSHCTAGCSATVGTTVKTIDPAALIGG